MSTNLMDDSNNNQIKNSLSILVKNNQTWVNWFNEYFCEWLFQGIPSLSKYKISLTGSRSVDLAYPQSDLEFAIVVPDLISETEKEKILPDICKFYERNNWAESYSQLKTKAGLLLLIAKNTKSGMWKLETTVRTETEHNLIQDNMNKIVRTWSEETRLEYILNMQKAFLDKDEAKMFEMKKWMKVL
jgi:hypothetical protein